MENLKEYEDLVSLRFQLFNSLFLTLPFAPLGKHGSKLPLFAETCIQQLEEGKNPKEIIEGFFKKILGIKNVKEGSEILFLFLQQIERQVVLFDAVEGASFPELKKEETAFLEREVLENLAPGRTLRLVLTSHPTQFYPPTILHLIEDLSSAVIENNPVKIRKILLQLGRTSFKNASAPTPLSEGEMLIEFYGPVFYQVYTNLVSRWDNFKKAPKLEIGFWPGGDRDGHPLVTAETTAKVSRRLKRFILKMYQEELQAIARRITFKGVVEEVAALEKKLPKYTSATDFYNDLEFLLAKVDTEHEGLFREVIARLMTSVKIFGFHFASLDIRQSSDVISRLVAKLLSLSGRSVDYASMKDEAKTSFLASQLNERAPFPEIHKMEFTPAEQDLLEVIPLIPEIQRENGTQGLHRIIISHTEKTHHMLEVAFLLRWMLEEEASDLDVVPLFESIEDLRKAPEIFEAVMQASAYRELVEQRGNCQTVMLGFSDGTKDGGYTTCNWEIEQCKEKLVALAKKEGVEVIFFDGRGGPPARGGGNTERYYRAVGERLDQKTIQLTVQGQTISSYFGTPASATYNILQLLRALTVSPKPKIEAKENALLQDLSEKAHAHYLSLRNDPLFIKLLGEATPLSYFGKLKVGSRPPKREKGELTLESLRAIPFVGAWSQMKVNLPAFYGLGSSLKALDESELKTLYKESLFFRTLLGNAAQALKKSYFPLTDYLQDDHEFGGLWKKIVEEGKLTAQMILTLSGQKYLMGQDLEGEKSISLREEIVRPLLVIQHYGLMCQRKKPGRLYEKLILKSIPANINASRNSA